MVKILEVKKAYFDMKEKSDFELTSVADLIDLAERKGIEVIYKKGKTHLLIDNEQHYFYAKG